MAETRGPAWDIAEKKLCVVLMLALMSIALCSIPRLLDARSPLQHGSSVPSPTVSKTRSLIHAAWLVPLLGLIISYYFVFGALDGSDKQCAAASWQPMIPMVAQLYMGHFGSGLHIREKVRHDFGGLLFANVLGLPLPSVTMPTLQSPMVPEELKERQFFFEPNYLALLIGAMVLYELLRLAVPKVTQATSDRFKRIAELVKPRHVVKPRQESAKSTPLLQDEQRTAAVEGGGGKEGEGGSTQSAATGAFKRKRNTGRRFKIYALGFITYYVTFQVVLYIWVDIAVAGGMINQDSGAAFELWSLGIELELLMHTLVCTVVYIAKPGMPHQHPSLLVMPVLMPVFGNVVHIMKDHVTQGLSFEMGRCAKSTTLSWVGVLLGYGGFAATITSLVLLLQTPECREGLRAGHWPVAEALPASPGSTGPTNLRDTLVSLDAHKERIMSFVIGSCTREKEVRALWGEVPHTVLHILFVFFFGGSDFMWFSIFLSGFKIFWIPILRECFIVPNLMTWKCSQDSARKLLVNEGERDERIWKSVYDLAEKRKWRSLLMEFFVQPIRFANYSTGDLVEDDEINPGTDDFTISMKITPSAITYGMLAAQDKSGDTRNKSIRLELYESGRIGFANSGVPLTSSSPWGDPNGYASKLITKTEVVIGQTYRIAVTREGAIQRLYVNGVEESVHDEWSVRQLTDHAIIGNAFRIGSRIECNYFQGNISNAMYVSRALTASELA